MEVNNHLPCGACDGFVHLRGSIVCGTVYDTAFLS